MLPETGDIIKAHFSLPDLVQKISQIFLLNLWKSTNSDFGALNFCIPTPNGLMPIIIRD